MGGFKDLCWPNHPLVMIFMNKHINFTSTYHVETAEKKSVLLNRFFVVKALVFREVLLTALVSAAAHYRETLTKLGWQRMWRDTGPALASEPPPTFIMRGTRCCAPGAVICGVHTVIMHHTCFIWCRKYETKMTSFKDDPVPLKPNISAPTP